METQKNPLLYPKLDLTSEQEQRIKCGAATQFDKAICSAKEALGYFVNFWEYTENIDDESYYKTMSAMSSINHAVKTENGELLINSLKLLSKVMEKLLEED